MTKPSKTRQRYQRKEGFVLELLRDVWLQEAQRRAEKPAHPYPESFLVSFEVTGGASHPPPEGFEAPPFGLEGELLSVVHRGAHTILNYRLHFLDVAAFLVARGLVRIQQNPVQE